MEKIIEAKKARDNGTLKSDQTSPITEDTLISPIYTGYLVWFALASGGFTYLSHAPEKYLETLENSGILPSLKLCLVIQWVWFVTSFRNRHMVGIICLGYVARELYFAIPHLEHTPSFEGYIDIQVLIHIAYCMYAFSIITCLQNVCSYFVANRYEWRMGFGIALAVLWGTLIFSFYSAWVLGHHEFSVITLWFMLAVYLKIKWNRTQKTMFDYGPSMSRLHRFALEKVNVRVPGKILDFRNSNKTVDFKMNEILQHSVLSLCLYGALALVLVSGVRLVDTHYTPILPAWMKLSQSPLVVGVIILICIQATVTHGLSVISTSYHVYAAQVMRTIKEDS